MGSINERFSDSATIGTAEYFLAADGTGGASYQTTVGLISCEVELSALLDGDLFRLRLYGKNYSGATGRVVADWYFGGVQNSPNSPTPAYLGMYGWEFSLTKISGTDRSIHWSIRTVEA